ncbi:hypothetical protein [Natronocalculus amylovorans]|uniref:Uncharacterized protein n=1 Tax=Natronocalculus amylovorans TaxID=2917812 RepID=A0AAE3FY06_9EURY|nr:hypothetical protein [Natronocalculus amylovorans]MCL9817447.1 hypothetical protein [Natronocalculus amylovorans]
MNKSWHSRRKFLATGATLTGAAIAGCIGAPATGETDAGEQFADEGEVNTSLEDSLEEPGSGSDLAGSAGDGEPDWTDAHNMRFRGWYYADEYDPAMPYERRNIQLAFVNAAGYSVDIAAFDEDGNGITDNRLNFAYSWWFNYSEAATVEINVVGSAQSEALTIDLPAGEKHEIWFGGAVLTSNYWIGRW